MRIRKTIRIEKQCPTCGTKRTVEKGKSQSQYCRSCIGKRVASVRLKPHRFIDITGQQFGKLIAKTIDSKRNGTYWWNCECSCGNASIRSGKDLRSRKVVCCGCSYITHNMSKSREYSSWTAMMDRCYQPTNKCYAIYGALGIRVDTKWHMFINFLNDMGKRPIGYTLDRFDSKGNYTKDNCRWADNKTQARNRNNNWIIEAFGKKQTLSAWAEETGIKWNTIRNRIKICGWDVEKSLTKMVRKVT